jgi:mRNA-degrading endonuclease RelE of RelBE toxin-antitoxin system
VYLSGLSGAQCGSTMFRIEFTPEAVDDLRLLRKHDQQSIIAAIESQLPDQATEEARNRKRLRTNRLSEWELRVGIFRVFYDVDAENASVKIKAIGYKQGSKLFVHGQEYDL